MVGAILHKSIKYYNQHHKDYISIGRIPCLSTKLEPIFQLKHVGLVMQGPICYENDFTITTLRIIRRNYPQIPIVVSTWENEANLAFEKFCANESIGLVVSEKPIENDKFHIKFQQVSTLWGIEAIKHEYHDVQYICKMRTDQRYARREFLYLLLSYLKAFPLSDAKRLHKRIVFLGTYINSSYYIPYHLSDFLAFGTVDDVEKLYSGCDGSITNYVADNLSYWYGRRDYITPYEWTDAEQFGVERRNEWLASLERCYSPEMAWIKFLTDNLYGVKTQRTMGDALDVYWRFLAECAIVVDARELLFIWPKYDCINGIDDTALTGKFGLDHAR